MEWEQISFPVPGRLGTAPGSGIPDMQGRVLVPDRVAVRGMVDRPDTLDRVLVPDTLGKVVVPGTLGRVLVPGTLGRVLVPGMVVVPDMPDRVPE